MSYSKRPGSLDEAIAAWLQNRPGAELREQAERLRDAYKLGKNSVHVDLAAYLTARMPATYAAVRRVLDEVAQVAPDFAPQSVLDVGAGPGLQAGLPWHVGPTLRRSPWLKPMSALRNSLANWSRPVLCQAWQTPP